MLWVEKNSGKTLEDLRKEIEDIIFDLGKHIQVLRIDKDNTILDIPYKEYVDRIMNAINNK